jgi:hypothetical protein
VKWKVPVPGGLSSPVVAGDKLVVTEFDGGKLYTIAYSRADGKEAWRAEAKAKQIEAYYKTEGSPAASTPATDGERIVSYFGSCGLSCYDLSGKELRKFEMPPVAIPGNFGSGVWQFLAERGHAPSSLGSANFSIQQDVRPAVPVFGSRRSRTGTRTITQRVLSPHRLAIRTERSIWSRLRRRQSLPPRLRRPLSRARSSRMRRMASAAAAKKWPRLFHCCASGVSTKRRYAS